MILMMCEAGSHIYISLHTGCTQTHSGQYTNTIIQTSYIKTSKGRDKYKNKHKFVQKVAKVDPYCTGLSEIVYACFAFIGFSGLCMFGIACWIVWAGLKLYGLG